MHFITHQKENVENATKMMETVLTWRKGFGINGWLLLLSVWMLLSMPGRISSWPDVEMNH